MAYTCDIHPDRTASVLITNLDNGDVVSVCAPECLASWASALAAAFTPEDTPEAVPAEDVPGPAATDGDTGQAATSDDITEPDDDDERGFSDDTIARALDDGEHVPV